jgi:hypothetical protein
MNVAIFGGLRRSLQPGWRRETVVAVLGGGDLDLSASPPGPDPRLTAVAFLGGVKIIVPPGTRVAMSGFGLFGGRDVTVSQRGDGPEIRMSLWAIFGGVKVQEAPPAATP